MRHRHTTVSAHAGSAMISTPMQDDSDRSRAAQPKFCDQRLGRCQRIDALYPAQYQMISRCGSTLLSALTAISLLRWRR